MQQNEEISDFFPKCGCFAMLLLSYRIVAAQSAGRSGRRRGQPKTHHPSYNPAPRARSRVRVTSKSRVGVGTPASRARSSGTV